jgi:hypothetical protein
MEQITIYFSKAWDMHLTYVLYIGSGKNGNAVSWGRMKNGAGQ